MTDQADITTTYGQDHASQLVSVTDALSRLTQ